MTQPAPWMAGWKPQPTNHRTAPAPEPERVKANPYGFIEPQRWPQDGGLRREPVVDVELGRVVRYVGWRNCMRCGHPFWSDDVQRLRLCTPQPNRNGCRNRQDDDGI